jgi:hypothetical protein
MADSFQINTSTWRLPPKSERPRINLPGVEDLEVSSEGIRAKETVSSVIDTSSWTLPKHEEQLETPKPKRAPGEPGPKDKKAPKDDRGRPALFGCKDGKGVHSEDVRTELRRLAGLERREHIEFFTGTPHRRLPDDSRVRLEEAAEPDVCFQPEPGRVVMSDEMRRLCGMVPSSSLPHAIHDADAPRRSTSAGILDAETESGQQFVERMLQESLPFFRVFGGIEITETPGGRRGPWRGNDDEEPVPQVIDALPGENPKEPGEEPEEPEAGAAPFAAPGEAPPEGEEPEEVPPEGEEPEAEPEEPEAEPEPEDDEDDEEVSEAREGGGALHRVGGFLKHAGAAASGSKAAQRAKERASGALHKVGSAIAKKHGIDVGKFYGTSDPGEQKRLAKVKGGKGSSIRDRVGAIRQKAAAVGRRARASLLRRVRPAKRIKVKARK